MSNQPVMSVLQRCEILFGDEVISRSLVVPEFSRWVINLLDDGGKNNGLIYHTGSIIFDVLLTVYLALACLVYDELTPQEVVSSLNPGDTIIFKGKTRAEFLGINENGFAKVQYHTVQKQHKLSVTETVSPSSFYKIKPYQGNSTILDWRGIRNDSRDKIDFMRFVFGKERSDIPGITNKAAVVVCSRDFADVFVDKVRIQYGATSTISITDLMPVSYFSENNEYSYRGNPGRNSPVLRFTNKVSVAREQVFGDDDKQILAFAVIGKRLVNNGISELPDLLNRNSLKKTFLSLSIMDEPENYCDTYSDARIFACTKEMLLKYTPYDESFGPLSDELNLQITNILNRRIIEHEADNIIDINTYMAFRQAIRSVRYQVHNDDLIDRFVIESYATLNYLSNIPFPSTWIEAARLHRDLKCPSVTEKIDFLKGVADQYGGALGNLLSSTLSVLVNAYHAVEEKNPKYTILMSLIERALSTGKLLILVPKAYYIDIFEMLLPARISCNNNLHIMTTSSFNHKEYYGTVILAGCLGSKRFSIFSIFAAPEIDCIMYPHERNLFTYQKRLYMANEAKFNDRSDTQNSVDDTFWFDEIEKTDMSHDIEFEDYMEELTIKNALQTVLTANGGTSTKADIVRVATTSDGESIFFTKYFSPYVFDHEQRTVTERTVQDICAGDLLLFTKNSDQTKDIVEAIIRRIADSNEAIGENLRKSKHWKKQLLRYKEQHQLSFLDLSNQMKNYGTPKHPATLRTWLNPESRVVAPREEDAFYQIALICEDDEMLASPENFYEACNIIRSLRIRILGLIGQHVIKSYQQDTEDEDTFLSALVREELDSLSQIVQIESIMDVSDIQVSVTYVNRPYMF